MEGLLDRDASPEVDVDFSGQDVGDQGGRVQNEPDTDASDLWLAERILVKRVQQRVASHDPFTNPVGTSTNIRRSPVGKPEKPGFVFEIGWLKQVLRNRPADCDGEERVRLDEWS